LCWHSLLLLLLHGCGDPLWWHVWHLLLLLLLVATDG
jgi:hypothetical protein